jgi:hypothetical protein
MECKRSENQATCPCTNTNCPRRGACCECLVHHLPGKTLPRCCFPAQPAQPPDRSFAGFAKAWKV